MCYKNKVTNEKQNSAFVLVIRSVDCEIQTFRPESRVTEIEDSHVNYYRKLLPKNSLALLCSHYKI